MKIKLTHNDLPQAVESLLEKIERIESLLAAKDGEDFERRQPDILNVDQTAAFLGLTKSGVYAKTFKKTIPHFRIRNSNRVRFSKKALILWLAEGEQKQAA